MPNVKIPNFSELLESDGPVCLVIKATLKPVGGTDRFQPAGFPEVGHVIYDAPRSRNGHLYKEKVCIVDSCASMANHLESVCMQDAGSLDLHNELTGLPYVVCETNANVKITGNEICSSENSRMPIASTLTEGHRLASDYFLDAVPVAADDKTFRQVLRDEFKIIEVKKDKTYYIPPETWWHIFQTIFKYDPNSLVHGVLFAKEQIKISRVLSSQIEAFGASRVGSSGVKFDRLQKTSSGQPIFSVDEETAERILATFVLDLALLRSFGRGENGLNSVQKEVLLQLALWKISRLLLQPFRYRSNCFLKAEDLCVSIDGDDIFQSSSAVDTESTTNAVVAWLKTVNIKAAIASAELDKRQCPTKVFYAASSLFKAGKEDALVESGEDVDEVEEND